MLQLLSAIEHLHDNWVIHRDLKTSNLLYSNSGILKVCDFGAPSRGGHKTLHFTRVFLTEAVKSSSKHFSSRPLFVLSSTIAWALRPLPCNPRV